MRGGIEIDVLIPARALASEAVLPERPHRCTHGRRSAKASEGLSLLKSGGFEIA